MSQSENAICNRAKLQRLGKSATYIARVQRLSCRHASDMLQQGSASNIHLQQVIASAVKIHNQDTPLCLNMLHISHLQSLVILSALLVGTDLQLAAPVAGWCESMDGAGMDRKHSRSMQCLDCHVIQLERSVEQCTQQT